jgi:hypothetical protein
MEFPKRAPNQRTHQTIKHNNQMKNPIRSLALGIALFATTSMVNAQSTLTYNATENVVATGTPFTFSQFNSSLGTLSAIDLVINSSAPGGTITISNFAGTAMNVDAIDARFRITADPTLGITAYNTSYLTMDTTPSAPLSIPGGGSQVFNIVGGQSFIGGSPVTRSINSSAFAQYLGLGSVAIATTVQTQIDTTGSNYNVSSGAFLSPTSMTLRYTYTPSGPVPVPEPGQVAASLLLLGGIGAYYFVKRRRKSTPAAA